MAISVQQSQASRFYAGLYLRTQNLTRFWGWGRAAFEQAWQLDCPQGEDRSGVQLRQHERGVRSKAQAQSPAVAQWSSLAQWLRMAHSSEFFKDESNARSAEDLTGETDSQQPSPITVESSGSPPTKKRRLRFVCDRKFIGLVIQ